MSGRPEDIQTKTAFEVIMRLIDRIFEYDAPFPNGLPKGFIEQYEKSGALDWHILYEDEEILGQQFFNEIVPDIGIPKIPRNWIAKELSAIGQQLESLDESFKPAHPRKLKDRFLSEGVRWMITTRVLKTILTCQLQFRVTISDLVQLAKEGNRTGLLKLATLDCTFLSTEFARKILRAVELEQDVEFKKKLSKAIAPRKNFWTLKHPKKNLRDAVALWVLSQLGYEDRPYSDWADFMEEQGFENLISAQNIASVVKNYEIPKKHPKRGKTLER